MPSTPTGRPDAVPHYTTGAIAAALCEKLTDATALYDLCQLLHITPPGPVLRAVGQPLRRLYTLGEMSDSR